MKYKDHPFSPRGRILTSLGITTILIVIIYFLITLPKPLLLEGIDFGTAVFDNQNQLLRLTTSQDEKYRLFISLSEIPQNVIEAALIKEDQYYFYHVGINIFSMMRAFWKTYLSHERVEGASTLSMQVARLRYHINSHHFSGKVKQIIYALRIERHYTKAEILEAYFNLAPYGFNIEGIKCASLVYFHQDISKLSLPQILTLTVIPQNPVGRTPKNISQLSFARRHLFSRWILKHPEHQQYAELMQLPMSIYTIKDIPFQAPHFVNHVLKTHRDDNRVDTTIDTNLQKMVSEKIHDYLIVKRNVGIKNVAAMLVDTRDMSIKAMVGSGNFFDKSISGQINGTMIPRSPGSALKPFVYALAMDQGLIHPATVLKDTPMHFGAFDVNNFDYHYLGPLKAKEALTLSRNIPAIYLASLLKNPTLYEFLKQAEIPLRTEKDYGIGLALGDSELTMTQLIQLYAMLANFGIYHQLRFCPEDPLDKGKRLLSAEASYLTLDMLQDTPRPDVTLQNFPVSWKTGTSSGFRDAWSVGIFDHYALAVWIGNFNSRGNPAFVGQTAAAPLFFSILHSIIIRQHLKSPFVDTSHLHLTRLKVCNASGLLPTHACLGTYETWFIPGKSPIKSDNIFREVMISPKTGKRTCHFDPQNRFEIYEFWPSDILKLYREAGISRRTPPPVDDTCRTTQEGQSPNITSPRDHLRYTLTEASSVIPLQATIDADVTQLIWFANTSFIGQSNRDHPMIWHPERGEYTIRVVDNFGRADSVNISVTKEIS